MRTLVAIDPGVSCSGVAVFKGEVLACAGLVMQPLPASAPRLDRVVHMAHTLSGWCSEAAEIVIERPQVYRAGRGKGDPNQLIVLAEIGACLIGMCWHPGMQVTQYLPHDWKGAIDPDVCVERVKMRLTVAEHAGLLFTARCCLGCQQQMACRSPSCPAHNMYDAIGIGLKRLGRFERTRVVVR